MAAIKPTIIATDEAVERLKRDYLPMWAQMAGGGAAVSRGAPSEVPYADFMRGSMREFDETGGNDPDPWVVNIIEAGIIEVSPRIPLARAALSKRYVLAAKWPAVYRSGRLQLISESEVHDLADAAELALVPVCRRRGLPL